LGIGTRHKNKRKKNVTIQRSIDELGHTLRLRDQRVQHLQDSLQEASIDWQDLEGLSDLRYIRLLFMDNRISQLNALKKKTDSLQRRVSSQEADLEITVYKLLRMIDKTIKMTICLKESSS
jgi:hypothetical protein